MLEVHNSIITVIVTSGALPIFLLPVRKIPHLELPDRRFLIMLADGSREPVRTGYTAPQFVTNILHTVQL